MFSYKIVHKVCYQFPNGRLLVPREFENNTYNAKFCWGKQIAARRAWKSEIERREVEVQFHRFKFGLLCLKPINIHYHTQTNSKMKLNHRKNWATAKCVPSAYLPTLPVFTGVSKFFIKYPGLPVRAPNLPDKMDFWAFLCFSLKFSPFFHKIRTSFIHCTVSGTVLHMFSQWQRLVRHCNDESAFWSHVCHVTRHIIS